MTADTEAELQRLHWGSRRGMLELDLLLLPFVEQVLPQLCAEQLQQYRRLLACEDQHLYGWLVQGEIPQDLQLARLVERIRAHAESVL